MLFNFKNNKLGMTLVEMVISLVVLSILMASTMGMIVSSNSLFISTSQSALDKNVGNGVFDLLESVLKYSTHMNIYSAGASKKDTDKNSQSISLSVTDNDMNSGKILYKRAEDNDAVSIYQDSFYNNRTVQYSIKEVGSAHKHIKLIVKVFRDEKVAYYREATIKCVNLGLITSGNNKNSIVDSSPADAVNQYITFTVDEMLMAGGKDAFSMEYKISEYMAKYNRIQSEYVGMLSQAFAKLNNNYDATDKEPGVKGTSNDIRDRIKSADYCARVNAVTRIIYGDGATEAKLDKENINSCVNLRGYYQQQIKDLLKFKPTAAGFTEGNLKSNAVGPLSYMSSTGDVFAGVVATKEELYAGFILTEYDKDGDGKIVKSEYPTFEQSGFFDGTSIATYLKGTGSDNQMVIMSLFKDNVADDDFSSLIKHYSQDVYAYDGAQAMAYDETLPKRYVSNDPNAFGGEGAGYYGYSSTALAMTGGTNLSVRRAAGAGFTGYKYTYNNNGSATVLGTYGVKEVIVTSANYEDTMKAIQNRMNPIQYTLSNGTSTSVNGDSCTMYTITADTDLYEGWYRFNEGGGATLPASYVIYIEAAAEAPVDSSGRRLAIKQGGQIKIYSYHYTARYYSYDQAQFSMGASGEQYTLPTNFTTIKAHQFTDYVLYGVDWNSWFNSSPSGILNKLMTGTIRFVQRIFGRDYNTDITSISGDNAVQSLGNRGQYTASSFDSSIASYNLAWVVYSPKRGTWYYIPSGSTKLSGAITGLSWTSNKDNPVPLDVDIERSGRLTWTNSTQIINDIDNRKLTDSGLFGLVDTSKDVIWVALPTGNTIDPGSLVTTTSAS